MLLFDKNKKQRKLKETSISKKKNKSGATLDERWRRKTKDQVEMDSS